MLDAVDSVRHQNVARRNLRDAGGARSDTAAMANTLASTLV